VGHPVEAVRPADHGSPLNERLQPLRRLFDELPDDLARPAFSHSSWVENRADSYERLAFLGDSVLNLAVSRGLFPRFAHYTAGRLTKIRAQAVSRRSCVDVARALEVPERMRAVAPDEGPQQIEAPISADSVLAEALEAAIGACLLAFGFERTAEAVADAFDPQVEFAIAHLSDFKSELQERLAQRGASVTYTVVREEGPPHDRLFETAAEVDGRRLGSGTGRSKKESEQEAARLALDRLGQE
jgi:ribonuclease III